MNQITIEEREAKIGVTCALISMVMWGALPIYWKQLQPIPPILIMFYRLVLSCVLTFIVAMFIYGWKKIWEPLKQKGAILRFLGAGIMISLNWGTYILMVNTGRVIQTSIGYYIEPLIICVFGIVLFREKLYTYKMIAFVLACIGAGIMVFSFGQVPLLAIFLASTFAIYAAIKKKLHAPAILSLFYETVLLLPVVIPWILSYELTGRGAFTVAAGGQLLWLSASGLVTATPLVLFAMGTNRCSMITLGIMEYISPSMGLILGIFLFKESFDFYQFIGFCVIWAALVVFTMGGIKEGKKAMNAARADALALDMAAQDRKEEEEDRGHGAE